jgi:hypothetical protein
MMNGKSGPAAASVARRLEPNQLELGSLFNAVALALWPGNWSISVSLSFEVLHHGTFVRVRQFQLSLLIADGCSLPSTLANPLTQTLG